MEFKDKSLVCVECNQTFVWTAGEQLFYHDRNFTNEPKRCKDCKGRRHERVGRAPSRAGGDDHDLLAVRPGDDGPLPAHPGAARPVQGVLRQPEEPPTPEPPGRAAPAGFRRSLH